jgi:hypothetical protein
MITWRKDPLWSNGPTDQMRDVRRAGGLRERGTTPGMVLPPRSLQAPLHRWPPSHWSAVPILAAGAGESLENGWRMARVADGQAMARPMPQVVPPSPGRLIAPATMPEPVRSDSSGWILVVTSVPGGPSPGPNIACVLVHHRHAVRATTTQTSWPSVVRSGRPWPVRWTAPTPVPPVRCGRAGRDADDHAPGRAADRGWDATQHHNQPASLVAVEFAAHGRT